MTEGESSKGDIELYEHQLPGDAVYEFCKREKYLQPKYTATRVRETLHASFCDALRAAGWLQQEPEMATSCALGTAGAREVRFRTEFTVYGIDYKMRYYAEDFPPCPGEVAEGPDDGESHVAGCEPSESRAASRPLSPPSARALLSPFSLDISYKRRDGRGTFFFLPQSEERLFLSIASRLARFSQRLACPLSLSLSRGRVTFFSASGCEPRATCARGSGRRRAGAWSRSLPRSLCSSRAPSAVASR